MKNIKGNLFIYLTVLSLIITTFSLIITSHTLDMKHKELDGLELLTNSESTYIQKEYQRLKKENDEWIVEYNKTHEDKIILNRLSDDYTYYDATQELEKKSNEALKKPVEIKEEDLRVWVKGIKQAKGKME